MKATLFLKKTITTAIRTKTISNHSLISEITKNKKFLNKLRSFGVFYFWLTLAFEIPILAVHYHE